MKKEQPTKPRIKSLNHIEANYQLFIKKGTMTTAPKTVNTVTCNGVKYNRIPVEMDVAVKKGSRYVCRECNTDVGQYHRRFCAMEQCPHCDWQLIGCGCAIEYGPADTAMVRKREHYPITATATWQADGLWVEGTIGPDRFELLADYKGDEIVVEHLCTWRE